ncbi:hypothetical protein [Paraburkholderia xenovorans]|uniref:hypothetical protein n=1 Tax=Paraburkholderia xenovorans TaxID=36873 RepID=UPI0038B98F36
MPTPANWLRDDDGASDIAIQEVFSNSTCLDCDGSPGDPVVIKIPVRELFVYRTAILYANNSAL